MVKKTFFDFEWKDEELWIPQKGCDDGDRDADGHYFFDYVEFGFNKKLALAMGWIFEDEQGTLWLSRNLEVADQVYPIPTGWNSKFSQKTETLNGIARIVLGNLSISTKPFETFWDHLLEPC